MAKRVGVRVSSDDNVITVVEDAAAGDSIQYMTAEGHQSVTTLQRVPLGHKVALKDIEAGEKIVKYNQTIGTASKLISRGEHVHVHNVRSAVQGVESES